jgi:hypothetical protein
MRSTTTVSLPPDQREWLRSIADAEDRSLSSVVRRLVTEARERQDLESLLGDSSSTASSSAA